MKNITKESIKKDFDIVNELLKKYSEAIWEAQENQDSHFDRQLKLVRLAMGDVRCGLILTSQALKMLADDGIDIKEDK